MPVVMRMGRISGTSSRLSALSPCDLLIMGMSITQSLEEEEVVIGFPMKISGPNNNHFNEMILSLVSI